MSGARALPPRPEAPLRLVCLPYAGGGASLFARWHQRLPAGIEVVAVQHAGREDRIGEPAAREFGPLYETTAASVEPWLDRPYALFGHSLGALLGFELAVRWTAAGHAPLLLFVAAAPPPYATGLLDIFDVPMDRPADQVDRYFGELPAAVREHPELLRLTMGVLAADLAAARSYRATPRQRRTVGAAVTAFAAEDDALVAPAEVAGWGSCTTGDFVCLRIPGHHLSIRDEWPSVVDTIARHLRHLTEPRGRQNGEPSGEC